MHRVTHSVDGLDVYTVGPFSLHAAEHGTLLWMVKAGEMVLGSVRLTSDRRQVAELTDLVLHATDERTQQSHSAKLMCAVAEYARDRSPVCSLNGCTRKAWTKPPMKPRDPRINTEGSICSPGCAARGRPRPPARTT